jgi:hypothetical protein
MVVHAYSSSTWEFKARGLGLQGQPELHSEILSQKKKKTMCRMSMDKDIEKLENLHTIGGNVEWCGH